MELQDRGYRVPEDVLVTGFDNVSIAKDNSPRITTVDCDRETMGYRACEYLMTKTAKRYKSFAFKYRLPDLFRELRHVKEKDRTMAEK